MTGLIEMVGMKYTKVLWNEFPSITIIEMSHELQNDDVTPYVPQHKANPPEAQTWNLLA